MNNGAQMDIFAVCCPCIQLLASPCRLVGYLNVSSAELSSATTLVEEMQITWYIFINPSYIPKAFVNQGFFYPERVHCASY